MPLYKDDRLPGGYRHTRSSTWEEAAADTIVNGAASAAGWFIGSGISGVRTLARSSKDRRLSRAAAALEEAMEEAMDSEDDDRFLSLARDFVRRYPQLADGNAALGPLSRSVVRLGGVSGLSRLVRMDRT